MKNAYNWYNVFILFNFVHEVRKMFTLVKILIVIVCTKCSNDGELVRSK